MNIAICDDEQQVTEQVKNILEMLQIKYDVELKIFQFCDAEDFKYDIEEGTQFDIVFMDIEIGKNNGIELDQKYMKQYPAGIVIFITAYTRYMKETFQVRPAGFVTKPIDEKDIEETFKTAISYVDSMAVFTYTSRGANYKILIKDIIYFESVERKIIIATLSKKVEFYGKMDEVEHQLFDISSTFFRISQSYIVNIKYMKKITSQNLVLEAGDVKIECNISKKYRKNVADSYMAILRR